jgi:hypothetical protein
MHFSRRGGLAERHHKGRGLMIFKTFSQWPQFGLRGFEALKICPLDDLDR